MRPYNQQLQQATSYSCSIYAFLHAILLDFGIRFEINNILWLNNEMKSEGALLDKGAVANIIFPAIVDTLGAKTEMSIGIKKRTIYDIDENKGRILGFKMETRAFLDFAKDGKITKTELDNIKAQNKYGYHFIYWKRGVVVDSLGGKTYELSLEDLKYALSLDMFYPACRTLYAKDKETEDMQNRLISLAKRKGHATKYDNFLNLL